MPSNLASTEHNDCAVRALAVVAGLTYEQAHYRLAVAGRKPRHKTKPCVSTRVYTEAGLKQFHIRPTTVTQFLYEHAGFTGILHVRGHLCGVVDGNILNDWMPSETGRLVKDFWTW